MRSSFSNVTTLIGIFLPLLLFLCSCFTPTEASNRLDRNSNITIKWDLLSWTPDGYVAVVTINNFQRNRGIKAPGWRLGWKWAKNEVIWTVLGAQATKQGDCSKFKGNIPHSCTKSPVIVDLRPNVPYNWQVENCCKSGVLSPLAKSAFQISVGNAGNDVRSVKLPKSFILKAPKDRYVCGPAKIVKPTKFITPDKRRVIEALMTWNVTCVYVYP